MSVEQASFLAQIISAIAIVASLIFVGFQLKKGRRRRCEIRNRRRTRPSIRTINGVITDNPEFASIWRRALANPNEVDKDERVRFRM